MLSSLLLRTAALLIAGAATGLLINAAHPRGVRFGSFAPPVACAQTATAAASPQGPAQMADSASPIETLSQAQVASLCSDPRALVVDARTTEEFAQGHVTGAIHLPCASSQGAASAALDRLAGKEILIVYGTDTDDAMPVAAEMRSRNGHPEVKVAVLAGGFTAWNRGGFACSSGPCPDCGGPAARR